MSTHAEQLPSEADLPAILTPEQFYAQFFERVTQCQAILDSIVPGAESQKLRQEIIWELDSMCPYVNETVCMNGAGVVPSFDEDGEYDGDLFLRTHGDSYVGVHAGTAIIPDPENTKRPLIVHQIVIESEQEAKGLTCIESRRYGAYFDMNTSVTFVSDLEESFFEESYETRDSLSEISRHASLVDGLVSSKKFRQRSQKGQLRRLQKHLLLAESELQIFEKELSIYAEYGYVPFPMPDRKQLIPFDLENMVLRGTCLGLISLDEQSIRAKPLRKKRERPDPAAGICLVVDPDFSTREELRLMPRQILYIPAGQDEILYELHT